jgi:thiol peroxidase
MAYEERTGGKTFGGRTLIVRGSMLKPGDKAPDFELVANDLSIKTLRDYTGKVKLISVIPSLETGVCDAQTRRFNEEATKLNDNVVVLTVSADLPFTQKRWCGAAGVENVETLSTHRDMKFSDDYGVHDVQIRVNQRSVFVVDAENNITYVEYVPVVGNEVNFEAALEAARQSISKQKAV